MREQVELIPAFEDVCKGEGHRHSAAGSAILVAHMSAAPPAAAQGLVSTRARDGWGDPLFTLAAWRKREAQLLKLLSTRHLKTTREAFMRHDTGNGLFLADFMTIMLRLLGMWVINREELVIQLLDLYASIGTGDGTMRW